MRILERKDVDGSSGDVYYHEIAGRSTETKPVQNIASGSVFIETNTGKVFLFDEDGGVWNEVSGSNGGGGSGGMVIPEFAIGEQIENRDNEKICNV